MTWEEKFGAIMESANLTTLNINMYLREITQPTGVDCSSLQAVDGSSDCPTTLSSFQCLGSDSSAVHPKKKSKHHDSRSVVGADATNDLHSDGRTSSPGIHADDDDYVSSSEA